MDEQRPKVLVAESDRLAIFTRCSTAPDKFSVFKWGIRENNPRVIVYTGDPDDKTPEKNYGRITGAMDPMTASVFCDVLETVAKGDYPRELTIPCFNSKYDEAGNIIQKKALISTIHAGRDEEGYVYIRVTAEGRPDVKFKLMISDWHGLSTADGTPLPAADISMIYATAYAKQLRTIFADCLKNTFTTERKPRKGEAPKPTTPAIKTSSSGDEISFGEDIQF